MARDTTKARDLFDPSYEIVPGDVTDTPSLEEAMQDCMGVHISIGGAVDQLSAERAAKLAVQRSVERITYISGATVREENRWFPMVAQKLAAENAIKASGLTYTIFCPTWPMEQLPRLAQGGQPMVIADQPVPFHWFAADDLARMVSKAYQTHDADNRKLWIYGPQAMSFQQALERYCQVYHPEVETIPVMPIAAARGMANSTGNKLLATFAEMMAYFEKAGEPGDPTEANDLLGAPTITLDEWLERRQSMT
jgi:uncharacterized protein YbjT (DUF2867 family)